MALDNIPTLGPGAFNSNLDKVIVHKNGGLEVACSLLTLTNSALNLSGVYLDTVNQRVGIGTNAPVTTLHIKGSGTTSSTAPFYVQNGANLGVFAIQDDTQIYSYASKFNIRSTGGDYGGWFQTNATQSLQITNNAYNNGTACALNLNGMGVLINSLPTNLGASARLHVIGQGSTSATTSLLVQNSGGTTAFSVRDDLFISTGGGLSVAGSISLGTNQAIGDGNFSLNVNRLESYNSYNITTLVQNRSIALTPGNTPILYANYWAGGNLAGVVVQDTTGTSQSTSAVLQANSTTRGFLPPRLTTTQKNAIATPAAGLMVYDTDLNRPCFYSGSAWVTL